MSGLGKAAGLSGGRALDAVIRATFRVAGGSGPSGRLSTFIFHRVLPRQDELFPGEMHETRFERLCASFARWFNVLPLEEALARLATGDLPARSAAITFDDGYADNPDIAVPILRRHGLSATFFVATGFLDGGCMFNDALIEAVRRTARDSMDLSFLNLPDIGRLDLSTLQARRQAIDKLISAAKYLPQAERDATVRLVAATAGVELPRDLMMSTEQLRALAQVPGMSVGGHTRHHPILARLSTEAALHEMTAGKSDLEAVVDRDVSLFAYPNGRPETDYSADSVALAKAAGFKAAVTTDWGVATRATDPYQIPRFTPWEQRTLRFAIRCAENMRRATPSRG